MHQARLAVPRRPLRAGLRLTPLALSIQVGIAAALALGASDPARAQTRAGAAELIEFDVPAGPLGVALNRYAQQAGVAIVVDAGRVQGLSTQGLKGRYGVDEGFAVLLRGTGHAIGKTSAGYVLVDAPRQSSPDTGEPQATLPVVNVQASAEASPHHLKVRVGGGALGARTQLETPLSTTVVTSADLSDRQVSKLGDVFALDASVTDNSGAYSSWASYVTVRGLELDWQNAYRIDGKPFLSYAITLPYEHFEQIELFKGASGFMYGFGSPGGLINYVMKKPTDVPLRRVGAGLKSGNVREASVDFGGRAGDDGRFGYRLDAVHEEGRTFNDGRVDRDSVSLALDARLTTDLLWDFQALYQTRKTKGQTPSISVAALAGGVLPSSVRGDDQTLLSKGQFLETDFGFYSTGLSYRLSPDWMARTHYSHSTSKRSRNESILYLSNAAGDYSENRSDTREGHRFDQWQGTLEGRLTTGGIGHELVAGLSWQKQLNDYSANGVWASIGSGNLALRNTNAYYTQGGLRLYRAGDIEQKAVFVSDTATLSARWSVLAGVRHTRYGQHDYNPDGSTQGSYRSSENTPTLALMFKAAPDTMIYASYMESLEPGRTVGSSYANANRLLDPMVSKQYEIGVKTERRTWSGTAALFRIERPSEYANAANVLVQDGESSYQGLELGLAGRLGVRWQLQGNVMLLDTSYDKGSANIGNRVAGAPRFMATTRVVYNVPAIERLRLMADAKHTGDVELDAANTLGAGSHTVFNVGADYVMDVAGCATTLRASINNVTNERFWEYQYANWIKPADPRSVSVSAQFDF
jgi:iron complex outermembrane recepter protein